MDAQVRHLMNDVQERLKAIGRVVGTNHRLTLVMRYVGQKPLNDADIIITTDDITEVRHSLDKLASKKAMGLIQTEHSS